MSVQGLLHRRFISQLGEPCRDGCQTRLDFNAYDSVPTFPINVEPSAAERQAPLSLASLLAVSLLLTLIAFRRFAR